MSYRLSPEALQQQLLLIAMPNLSVLISIFGIIFLLRMMRRERERNATGRAEVVAMPTRVREAA
jgi:putative exporter of polyketide antibiotics